MQYGDIFSLYLQERFFNKIGPPYSRTAIYTNEDKVGLTCKSVSITNNIAMYRWLLEPQAEMEPRWYVTNVRLIFGDGFISDNLLDQLGIIHGCLLSGDYYHLMNES